jgi:hypothetical protein
MTSTAQSNHRNQRDRIVAVLLQARGTWVGGRELAAISLQYNARIFEARHHLLLNIENKTEIAEDGTRLSWFRLLLGADRDEPRPQCSNVGIMPPPQEPLFPGFCWGEAPAPERHRDDG